MVTSFKKCGRSGGVREVMSSVNKGAASTRRVYDIRSVRPIALRRKAD